MKNIKTVFLLSILFTLIGTTWSQKAEQYIGLMSKHEEGKVSLKWFPSSIKLWQKGIDNGYDVYRQDLNDSNSQLTKITEEPLKLWDEDRVKEVVEKDENLAGILLFMDIKGLNNLDSISNQEAANRSQIKNFTYGMSGLASNVSMKVSEMAGLSFVDDDVQKEGKYYYEVRFHEEDETLPKAPVVVDLNKPYKVPTPYAVEARFKENKVTLQWRNDYRSFVFSHYNIYRSTEKDGDYIKLNKKPFIGVASPLLTDQSVTLFYDSIPLLNTTYYYKIEGVSPFEDKSDFSDIVEGKGLRLLHAAPEITEWPYTAEGLELTWYMPEEEKQFVQEYIVQNGHGPYDKFEQISERKILPYEGTYLDKTPRLSNFYRLGAIGTANDTTFSAYVSVLLPDTISPEIPTDFTGVVDTNGLVHLSWAANTDEDLDGYRLYRRNTETDEFNRVTNEALKDTFYVDTLSFKVGYKNIRYKLYALDKSFRTSEPTEELSIEKPDVFPPQKPYWISFYSTDKGISLKWWSDQKEDVEKHVLLRMGGVDKNFRTLKTFEGESLSTTTIIDNQVKEGVKYTYTILSYDQVGNVSDSCKIITVDQKVNYQKKIVESLDARVSRANRQIKLEWEIGQANISYFKIYRQSPERGLSYHKSVKGNVREYYDEEHLTPDTNYNYAVQAIYLDGTKSSLSQIIEVKY